MTTTTMTKFGDREMAAEHRSIFDPRTCTRRGICPATQTYRQRQRLQGHSLYFEVHGSGPQKVVLIMGLGNSCFAWLPQVDHFSKLEQYTTLVFDNRGIGMSDCSPGLYSTSGMAEDTLCLLDYLQWTEDRSLHVVGVSMGGMISQELAYRIPERIASLSLVVTRAGGSTWANMPSLSGCYNLARAFSTLDQDLKMQIMTKMIFPEEWMDSLAKDDSEGRTNREIEVEFLRRTVEITKPQTLAGTFGQMVAAVTHRMAPERLAKVSASVPKVLILSAGEDETIPYVEGEKMKRYMPEAEYQCWERTGHAISLQHKKRFNQVLETVFEQGKEAAKRVHSSHS